MTLQELLNALGPIARSEWVNGETPVYVIANGVKYPVNEVWIMQQTHKGAIVCIGDDPR